MHKFSAKAIVSMNQTSLLTVASKIPKIVTAKGTRSAERIVSGERGPAFVTLALLVLTYHPQ